MKIQRIIEPLRQLARKGASWIPKLTREGWLFLALPFGVCVSFISSVGPELQRALFSSLSGTAPNIYSALNEESIAHFWTLLQWLSGGLHWLSLSIGAFVVVTALRANTLRSVSFVAGVAFFSCLTLIDIGVGLVTHLSITEHLTNVTANLAGSIVVAVLVGAALALYAATIRAIKGPRLFAQSLSAAILALFGVTISTLAYSGLRFFYEPLPVRVAFTLTPPVGGYFVEANRAELEGDMNPFLLVPDRPLAASATIEAVHGTPRLEWANAHPENTYRLEVRLFQGCTFERFAELPIASPIFTTTNIEAFSLEPDDGVSLTKLALGTYAFQLPERPAHYNISLNETREIMRFNRFTSEAEVLRVASRGRVDLLFTAPLMHRRGDGMITAPRTLTLELNDTVQQWRFVPPGNADQDQRVRCRPIAPRGLRSELVVEEVALTALISLIPTSDADSPTYSTDAIFTFTHVDGWTWIDDLSLDEVERSAGGEFRAISAEQNVSSLEVDGRSVSMGPYDNLWVIGDLLGAHGDNAEIAVNGIALAAWKNGERLIPTRWERAPNWQLPLLTTFFGTIAGLLALVRLQSAWLRKVGGENPRSWLRH